MKKFLKSLGHFNKDEIKLIKSLAVRSLQIGTKVNYEDELLGVSAQYYDDLHYHIRNE